MVRWHDAGLEQVWSLFKRKFSFHRIPIAWGSLAVTGVLVLAGWAVRFDRLWTSADAPGSNVTRQADLTDLADLAERTGDPVSSLATLATLPDQATGQIDQWLVTAMVDRQWAYLEHDARLVTQWFVQDLP